jgi:ubiquinone/menaquinone biosynthesis C-methylase UbiE
VSFKLGNILEGLDYPDNTFDVVHFRFFILAFKKHEWAPILKEIMRVLKPGGYIVSKEAGMLVIYTYINSYIYITFANAYIGSG